MGADDDIREMRGDLKLLGTQVARNSQQLENGPGFRADLDELKSLRAGPRLTGLEAGMDEVKEAVADQGHSIRAMTQASEELHGEIKAARIAKATADAKAAEDAAEEEKERKKDAADFRKRIQNLATNPIVLGALFTLLTAFNVWKSDADKQEALAAFQAIAQPVAEAPVLVPADHPHED